MKLRPELRAHVDEEGRVIFPLEVASRYGLKPEAQLRIEDGEKGLRLRQPVSHLAKVYVEVTNRYRLELPKMDVSQTTRKALYEVMRAGLSISLAGANDRCPFIEQGVAAIAWDASLSPCLPLLHSHVSFLHEQERVSRRYVIGKVTERDVRDLWNAPEYVAFRERVQSFDFSPCTACGGCNLSETNEEDCFGNSFPTCGGCLWAQGLIQCP